jgi:hypothetical protein
MEGKKNLIQSMDKKTGKDNKKQNTKKQNLRRPQGFVGS